MSFRRLRDVSVSRQPHRPFHTHRAPSTSFPFVSIFFSLLFIQLLLLDSLHSRFSRVNWYYLLDFLIFFFFILFIVTFKHH